MFLQGWQLFDQAKFNQFFGQAWNGAEWKCEFRKINEKDKYEIRCTSPCGEVKKLVNTFVYLNN